MKKKAVIAVICAAIMLGAAWIYIKNYNPIEAGLVAAVDERCAGEGNCEIDLAEVFTGFEWDEVSLFAAGNPKQVREALGVENDISDGIVFSLNGEPVKVDMSTYGFPHDELPLVSYGLGWDRDPYYITLPRENAVVAAKKFLTEGGEYRYWILPRGTDLGW